MVSVDQLSEWMEIANKSPGAGGLRLVGFCELAREAIPALIEEVVRLREENQRFRSSLMISSGEDE